ncbi:MAG TPA: putative glycoside hydrolase [Bacillus bacterium]|nr:putative glycoside hydrolase [Bacillus sp. (in: firmicutes)]
MRITYLLLLFLTFGIIFSNTTYAQEQKLSASFHAKKYTEVKQMELIGALPRFKYDTGLSFPYPDAVRGVYMTAHTAGGYKNYLDYYGGISKNLSGSGKNFAGIMNLMDTTDLNAVVIDMKDDWGNLTYLPEEGSAFTAIGKPYIKNPRELLELLEKKQVYPIARIVVFKDTVWAKQRPDLSFLDNGAVWKNGRKESFVNPFLKEVWDHNVQIAIEAAKLGFKEVQFDYVRFPEGFEKRDQVLAYSMGEYKAIEMDNVQKRVQAITDFVAYAREKLKPYDVKLSVDIFGYTATLPEAPGIGQNFSKIAENVDVISSMIYPSHWTSYFGIAKPDLQPYRLVSEYTKMENAKLNELKNRPISRPWLQDFTATYLGKGNYMHYGKAEVEAQIKALNENGIQEFLLWDAANTYTLGVDYTPLQK